MKKKIHPLPIAALLIMLAIGLGPRLFRHEPIVVGTPASCENEFKKAFNRNDVECTCMASRWDDGDSSIEISLQKPIVFPTAIRYGKTQAEAIGKAATEISKLLPAEVEPPKSSPTPILYLPLSALVPASFTQTADETNRGRYERRQMEQDIYLPSGQMRQEPHRTTTRRRRSSQTKKKAPPKQRAVTKG